MLCQTVHEHISWYGGTTISPLLNVDVPFSNVWNRGRRGRVLMSVGLWVLFSVWGTVSGFVGGTRPETETEVEWNRREGERSNRYVSRRKTKSTTQKYETKETGDRPTEEEYGVWSSEVELGRVSGPIVPGTEGWATETSEDRDTKKVSRVVCTRLRAPTDRQSTLGPSQVRRDTVGYWPVCRSGVLC